MNLDEVILLLKNVGILPVKVWVQGTSKQVEPVDSASSIRSYSYTSHESHSENVFGSSCLQDNRPYSGRAVSTNDIRPDGGDLTDRGCRHMGIRWLSPLGSISCEVTKHGIMSDGI